MPVSGLVRIVSAADELMTDDADEAKQTRSKQEHVTVLGFFGGLSPLFACRGNSLYVKIDSLDRAADDYMYEYVLRSTCM